jgi:hypothetical protein
MTIVFKFVTGTIDPRPSSADPMPLGLLTDVENNTYPDLMIGTDCAHPVNLDASANWHFRVENVPAYYIASHIFPLRLEGPVPETYGTWFHATHTPCRDNCFCNGLGNWPLYFVQTENDDGNYTWDIFVVPYLGGSSIPGIEPELPIAGTQYTLVLFNDDEEEIETTLTSEPIPALFPIFGTARNGKTDEDFYPAIFVGPNYEGSAGHAGVDIIPYGLFAGGPPVIGWDQAQGGVNEVYRSVFAVAGGSLVHTTDTGLPVVVLDTNSPYHRLEFRYIHVTNREPSGPIAAGDKIADIINHELDPDSDATHLHFEVYDQTKGRIVDPRQFLNPGLIPNP